MPRGKKGPTLATVKQNCRALNGLSHLGPEGFHWRVCVEDKPAAGEESSKSTLSWWDIQDENAVLPIKQASSSQLGKFFSPPKEDSSDATTKAVRGAAKGMMRAMAGAVAGSDSIEQGPPVSVIAFKLLDMVKMNDDFKLRNPGRAGGGEQPYRRASAVYRPPSAAYQPAATPAQPPRAPTQTPTYQAPQQAQRPASAPRAQPAARPATAPAQGNLMDFAPAPAGGGGKKNLYHTTSSPAAFNAAAANPNENRAEKLKREYEQKKQKASAELEWDEVEQRMVQKGSMKNGSQQGAPAGAAKAKIQGTKLDSSSTIGKSAHVAGAVNKRINDMKASQDKALREIREREAKASKDKEEEDEVRKRLEPKIKAWSEEHGKKKQLRALLGTLHTILWPGANWKPVSIGDMLDDSKVKKFYHKASRVVHPDKTHSLNSEQRFLAKRIFDALTQAKVDFDSGKQ